MPRLLEAPGGCIRILAQRNQEIVPEATETETGDFDGNFANIGVVSSLVWCSEEDKEAGGPHDRLVFGIQSGLDKSLMTSVSIPPKDSKVWRYLRLRSSNWLRVD